MEMQHLFRKHNMPVPQLNFDTQLHQQQVQVQAPMYTDIQQITRIPTAPCTLSGSNFMSAITGAAVAADDAMLEPTSRQANEAARRQTDRGRPHQGEKSHSFILALFEYSI
ncbi:unnamed protein product [Protopolystoma xenopodis]|uniref:Uncharacterized protein n=1 Tax=Protopolystoma xenopodis TaxID=117903 RepID=A0A448WX47_9PLAT|nr:unnamed protein product [Protopolystoma xenopodis]